MFQFWLGSRRPWYVPLKRRASQVEISNLDNRIAKAQSVAETKQAKQDEVGRGTELIDALMSTDDDTAATAGKDRYSPLGLGRLGAPGPCRG